MKSLLLLGVVASLLTVGCGPSANTNDNSDMAATGNTDSASASQHDSAIANGADLAMAATDGAAACNNLVNDAPMINKMHHAGPPPTMTGGAIADGTYLLTAMDQYNGENGNITHQEKWVFSGGMVQVVSMESGMTIRVSGTYATALNMVQFTFSCPPLGMMSNLYTATPTQIQAINSNDANEMHTFTKQ